MQTSLWLKKQILNALVVSVVFSIIVFAAVFIIIKPYLNLLTMMALGAGGILGVKLSTRIPVNPLYFVPIWRRNPAMTNEEVITALMPYWERFPRYWLYLTLSIYMLFFLIAFVINNRPEKEAISLMLPGFILGIMLSGSFVPAVYLSFVNFMWEND